MPDRTTQRELDKFGALLELIAQDGTTRPGQIPVDHLDKIKDINDIDREYMKAVVESHGNGNPPPERGNN